MSVTHEMGTNAEPASPASRVNIGIAALADRAVRPAVEETRVDQSHVTEDADIHIDRLVVLRRAALLEAREKPGLVDEGTVRIGRAVILREVVGIPAQVGLRRRTDVVAVEF